MAALVRLDRLESFDYAFLLHELEHLVDAFHSARSVGAREHATFLLEDYAQDETVAFSLLDFGRSSYTLKAAVVDDSCVIDSLPILSLK